MNYLSDEIERVLIEVMTGKSPTPPDTPELATLRLKLKKECDAIRAQGKGVEIPSEVP